MRWPWKPRPGMVRVSRREYVALLEGAVRAARLDAEMRVLRAETAQVRAEARAFEVLVARATERDVLNQAVERSLLADLPLTADGSLHDAGFAALVERRVWEQRDIDLAAVLAAAQDGDGA